MGLIDEIFRIPIDELADPKFLIRLARNDVRHWGLNERDEWSLTSVGLPLIERARFIPNAEPGPESVTMARQVNEGTITEWEGYHLGTIGRWDVCLLSDSLNVVAVPGEHVTPAFVNSSAAQYIECSWRYYWLYRKASDPAVLGIEIYDMLDEFLVRIEAVDAATRREETASEDAPSLWHRLIRSF